MKKILTTAAVVVAAATATPALAAGLVGVQVTGTLLYPNQNTNYNGQTPVTTTVTDPGVEFPIGFFGGPGGLDVGANTITFITNHTGGYGSDGPFNGYRLDFAGRRVTSFSLRPGNTYQPAATFSGSSIFINVLGTSSDGSNVVFDIQTTAVPEPATWAMMLLGFGMVGFGLRSRRDKVTARVAFA